MVSVLRVIRPAKGERYSTKFTEGIIAAIMALAPGTRLGRYAILAFGVGGTGKSTAPATRGWNAPSPLKFCLRNSPLTLSGRGQPLTEAA